MKQDNNPFTTYALAAGVAGQVGCLLSVTTIGSVLLGLLFDQILGTKPLFLFVLLLGSIPLNIWLIFRYAKYKSISLQDSSPEKEDVISE